jgi:NADH dehydrogenase (ubiquinone) Fe-S protein 6
MLPLLRLRSPALLRRTAARAFSSTVDRAHPSNPKPQTPVQNVSATNATPTSSEGSADRVLVETVEEAEEMRVMQAPNREGIWSRSQQPRAKAMLGPRFEQTIMDDQVCLNSS